MSVVDREVFLNNALARGGSVLEGDMRLSGDNLIIANEGLHMPNGVKMLPPASLNSVGSSRLDSNAEKYIVQINVSSSGSDSSLDHWVTACLARGADGKYGVFLYDPLHEECAKKGEIVAELRREFANKLSESEPKDFSSSEINQKDGEEGAVSCGYWTYPAIEFFANNDLSKASSDDMQRATRDSFLAAYPHYYGLNRAEKDKTLRENFQANYLNPGLRSVNSQLSKRRDVTENQPSAPQLTDGEVDGDLGKEVEAQHNIIEADLKKTEALLREIREARENGSLTPEKITRFQARVRERGSAVQEDLKRLDSLQGKIVKAVENISGKDEANIKAYLKAKDDAIKTAKGAVKDFFDKATDIDISSATATILTAGKIIASFLKGAKNIVVKSYEATKAGNSAEEQREKLEKTASGLANDYREGQDEEREGKMDLSALTEEWEKLNEELKQAQKGQGEGQSSGLSAGLAAAAKAAAPRTTGIQGGENADGPPYDPQKDSFGQGRGNNAEPGITVK